MSAATDQFTQDLTAIAQSGAAVQQETVALGDENTQLKADALARTNLLTQLRDLINAFLTG